MSKTVSPLRCTMQQILPQKRVLKLLLERKTFLFPFLIGNKKLCFHLWSPLLLQKSYFANTLWSSLPLERDCYFDWHFSSSLKASLLQSNTVLITLTILPIKITISFYQGTEWELQASSLISVEFFLEWGRAIGKKFVRSCTEEKREK